MTLLLNDMNYDLNIYNALNAYIAVRKTKDMYCLLSYKKVNLIKNFE